MPVPEGQIKMLDIYREIFKTDPVDAYTLSYLFSASRLTNTAPYNIRDFAGYIHDFEAYLNIVQSNVTQFSIASKTSINVAENTTVSWQYTIDSNASIVDSDVIATGTNTVSNTLSIPRANSIQNVVFKINSVNPTTGITIQEPNTYSFQIDAKFYVNMFISSSIVDDNYKDVEIYFLKDAIYEYAIADIVCDFTFNPENGDLSVIDALTITAGQMMSPVRTYRVSRAANTYQPFVSFTSMTSADTSDIQIDSILERYTTIEAKPYVEPTPIMEHADNVSFGYMTLNDACAADITVEMNAVYTNNGVIQAGSVVYWDETGSSTLSDGFYKRENGSAMEIANGVVSHTVLNCTIDGGGQFEPQ